VASDCCTSKPTGHPVAGLQSTDISCTMLAYIYIQRACAMRYRVSWSKPVSAVLPWGTFPAPLKLRRYTNLIIIIIICDNTENWNNNKNYKCAKLNLMKLKPGWGRLPRHPARKWIGLFSHGANESWNVSSVNIFLIHAMIVWYVNVLENQITNHTIALKQ